MIRAIHHKPFATRYRGLAISGFLFGIAYGIFSLSVPILAQSVFKHLALLSLVFTIPEIVGVIFDIPLGAFANRFGRRRIILFSGILLAIAAALFTIFHHPLFFIVPMIIYGIATQSYIIPADAELVAVMPARNRGKFSGVVEGVHNFGFSIGPVLAGILLSISINAPFFLAIVVSLAIVPISIYFLPPEHSGEGFNKALGNIWRRDKMFQSSLQEFSQLGFLGMFLVFLFFVFALHWGFIALMEPLYTDALHFDSRLIGLIYAGFTIPFLLVSILSGRYIDRRGAKGIAIGGLLLMALSTLGFGLTQNPRVLFIFSLVAGIGDAFLLPAIMSTLARLSLHHVKEQISGVKIFAESAGYLLGPLVGGVLASFFGFQFVFILLGLSILLLALVTIFVRFHDRTHLSEDQILPDHLTVFSFSEKNLHPQRKLLRDIHT